jgi:hypothetical protein
MRKIFAEWRVRKLPDEISDIHISCGVARSQHLGFSLENKGSSLFIENKKDGFYIKFICFDNGLTDEEDWWLSPSLINEEEAMEFGIEE